MADLISYDVTDAWSENAWIDGDKYRQMYQQSIDEPDQFWAQQASEFLQWESPWTEVCHSDFSRGSAVWFKDAKLNVTVNCIDRHLPTRADQTAIIWEGDDPSEDKRISYQQLHDEVARMANVLRQRGVKKGDPVCIYMPMIPEAAYAMLACARIGAIHSVVFGGFSPEALKDRILDSDCRMVITADEGYRGENWYH
jgi:acetyl-CoA synthetase